MAFVVEYVPPTYPAHLTLLQIAQAAPGAQKLQEVFSPFSLTIDLTLSTVGCDGISNAEYNRPGVSVFYEYLNDIYQTTPKETTKGSGTSAASSLAKHIRSSLRPSRWQERTAFIKSGHCIGLDRRTWLAPIA